MTDRKSSDGKQASEAAPAASTDDSAAYAETTVGMPKRDGGTAEPQVWVDRTLGKYQITSVLGQGAMGVVLKSRDPLIERDVAIKVPAEHLATDTAAAGRFLSEAKSAGKLNHPNVMAIYEICQEGSLTYLVLEFVGGGNQFVEEVAENVPVAPGPVTGRGLKHQGRLWKGGRLVVAPGLRTRRGLKQ